MALRHVDNEEQLEAVFRSELAVIFKHSTACAPSAVAMEELENFAAGEPDVDVHVVDVLEHRHLSQKTAAYLNVQHQSPQVIVVRRGSAVWHESHFGITAARVKAALSAL